jgi:hypothetical protein
MIGPEEISWSLFIKHVKCGGFRPASKSPQVSTEKSHCGFHSKTETI